MDRGLGQEDLECAISEEVWSSDEEDEPPKTQDQSQGKDQTTGQDQQAGQSQPNGQDQATGQGQPSQPKKPQDKPKNRKPEALLQEELKDLPQVTPREELQLDQIVHSNISCNACKQSVVGVRFKCQVCPNYNICDMCETRGNHAEHDMMAISFPLYIRPARKEDFELTLHEDTTCDECRSFPIRGVRYKCMVCQNYDLCQDCERRGKHPQHDMCAITYPLWKRPGLRGF